MILFVPFADFLEDVREVSGFDGSANTIHRINHDDVFQSVELWAVQYDFTCRFTHHHALILWRWWHHDTARWERDGIYSFECLPHQVHANSSSAGSIGYVIQNLGDVKSPFPLPFGARVAVQRPASLL
jgi:hypothetical protein